MRRDQYVVLEGPKGTSKVPLFAPLALLAELVADGYTAASELMPPPHDED